MDVDSLILQREAMSLLHEIVLASARIYGAEAFLADSKYERLMRDVTTLMSSALYVCHAYMLHILGAQVDEDFLVNGIAMGLITSWTERHNKILSYVILLIILSSFLHRLL
jgi:hypothetical protein